MKLPIAHDHLGRPLPAGQMAELEIGRDEQQLVVRVDAPFFSDPAPAQPAGATDRLWEYEVCELFIAADGDEYLEIELGPHGHHLVLQLRGVRQVARSLLPIAFQASIADGRWYGVARVPLVYLPAQPSRVNAYMMHGQGARRVYCAHSAPRVDPPDFHRLESFVPLRLP